MWQERLFDEIRMIDREQVPHGLYGIRDIASDVKRKLKTLGKILGKDQDSTNVVLRLGGENVRVWDDTLTFTLPGPGVIHLDIRSHASTKVRQYGDCFVLDRVHGKKPGDIPSLDSMVPKVLKKDRGYSATGALLFIVHVGAAKELGQIPGKAGDAAFLERYGISFFSRTWEDIHGRGFHTGLFLWTPEPG